MVMMMNATIKRLQAVSEPDTVDLFRALADHIENSSDLIQTHHNEKRLNEAFSKLLSRGLN